MEGPQQRKTTKLQSMCKQQLSIVIGLLTGHLGQYGHLNKIGKGINPLCNGNETFEYMLCARESLTVSRGCIFGQSFRELQQLSDVPMDLFRRFAVEIVLTWK